MSEQKVVLISGASGHLGAEIVRESARAGWAVALHYRSGENAVARLLEESTEVGTAAIAVQADLAGDPSSAERIVREVIERFGRLDGLVNNSADQTPGALDTLNDEDWQQMLAATFLSATRLSAAAIKVLAPAGSVVNVSSVEASSAFPNHAHYAASKAALESFTRSLALDLGPMGMRANAIAPGLIGREGLEVVWPEGHAWWTTSAPNRRTVTAAEVASAAVFLLSDRASGINGVVLPVDGGWTASARAPF